MSLDPDRRRAAIAAKLGALVAARLAGGLGAEPARARPSPGARP